MGKSHQICRNQAGINISAVLISTSTYQAKPLGDRDTIGSLGGSGRPCPLAHRQTSMVHHASASSLSQ
jgi:hypothetical protein